jgi:exo-beta-1,3-glucanase (GH17 family)
VSYKKEKFTTFNTLPYFKTEVFTNDMSYDDIKNLFLEILNNGIHGLCFSPYVEGQKPGDTLSEDQIRKRMLIIKPYISWVRSFSTTEGNELIPKIAKEYGIKTLVGAWIGNDMEKNEIEINNLIALAKEGLVDVAAIGNEVLYRDELTVDQLLHYINYSKSHLNGVPVGYVDAYYEFPKHPELVEACDVILANFYPFWEGTSFDDSLQHKQYMLQRLLECANGKKIVVSETGWPSEGGKSGEAEPSLLNAMKYFINSQLWSFDQDIEMFYFSSFDETWKLNAEGNVGGSWGLWDKDEKLKYV